jgi:hypothetical protein
VRVHLINQREKLSGAMTLITASDVVVLVDIRCCPSDAEILSQLGCRVVRLSPEDDVSEAGWPKTGVPLISEQAWVRYTLSSDAVVSWG